MPWKVVKSDGRCTKSKPWAVVKTAGNELEGCHRSKSAANKQLAALNASETNERNIMDQLIESYSTDVEIREQEDDPNILGQARFQISEIDRRNRNGRVYPRDVWEAQVQRFTRGSVTGQDGHPSFFETPKVTDAFLVFSRLEIQGDKVFAEADVVNTPQGKAFVAVAKAGARIADSTRGFGSVESVEKWNDGKPANIVQSDFKLLGVDVMFDGYQSVPDAKMKGVAAEAVHFVHEDWKEIAMEDITAEWLQENHSSVVEELTHALEHERDELNEQVETLTAEVEAATASIEEGITKLEEATARIIELEDQLEESKKAQALSDAVSEEYQTKATELEEANAALLEERDTFQAKTHALQYAQDRVVGEPAAMLMLRELAKCETKDEVRESFARIKRDAEAMLASLPPAQGQSRYVANENDDEQPQEISREAQRYAAMTGLRPH